MLPCTVVMFIVGVYRKAISSPINTEFEFELTVIIISVDLIKAILQDKSR